MFLPETLLAFAHLVRDSERILCRNQLKKSPTVLGLLLTSYFFFNAKE